MAIAIVETSVGRGLGSNAVPGGTAGAAPAAWPTQMANTLRAQGVPMYSESWFGGGNVQTTSTSSFTGQDPRVTFSGAASSSAANSHTGLGGNFWNAPATTDFAFLPSPYAQLTGVSATRNTDTCFFVNLQNPGYSTYTTNINCGANLQTIAASGTNGYQITKVPAALGANTWHAVSAGSNAFVGMLARNSAQPEISILNFSVGSSTTTGWLDKTTPVFYNGLNGVAAVAANAEINLTTLVLALDINDMKTTTQISLAQFNANYTELVQYFQGLGLEVVCMSKNPIAITGSFGTAYAVQKQYADEIGKVAAATGCLYIDTFDQFPTYEIGVAAPFNLYQATELVHPNIYGQAKMALTPTQLFASLWK